MELNIKELRTKYGFSQKTLSDKIGIPEGRINNWEQGKGKPKYEDRKKLLDFFQSFEVEKGKIISRETKTSTFAEDPEESYGAGAAELKSKLAEAQELTGVLKSLVTSKDETIFLLKNENTRLTMEVAQLRNEVAELKARLSQYEKTKKANA